MWHDIVDIYKREGREVALETALRESQDDETLRLVDHLSKPENLTSNLDDLTWVLKSILQIRGRTKTFDTPNYGAPLRFSRRNKSLSLPDAWMLGSQLAKVIYHNFDAYLNNSLSVRIYKRRLLIAKNVKLMNKESFEEKYSDEFTILAMFESYRDLLKSIRETYGEDFSQNSFRASSNHIYRNGYFENGYRGSRLNMFAFEMCALLRTTGLQPLEMAFGFELIEENQDIDFTPYCESHEDAVSALMNGVCEELKLDDIVGDPQLLSGYEESYSSRYKDHPTARPCFVSLEPYFLNSDTQEDMTIMPNSVNRRGL